MTEALFWLLTGLIFMSVAGYGLFVIFLAAIAGGKREPARGTVLPLHATLLIAAHNEQHCIRAKLENALRQESGPHRIDILVVSDGSTDQTAATARSVDSSRVRVIEIKEHVGKIPALNAVLADVGGDAVIFSDANSEFADGALRALLDRFADPRVGGVSGALAISRQRSGWLGRAERLYWRYDNALKLAESRLAGAVSAQGSLYAVRRNLIGRIPPSVADDFYVSTGVVKAGQRLAFEPAAVTMETVTGSTKREFLRRVRSTERGWRGLLSRAELLNPMRTGFYAVQLLLHKVLRRLTPFLLAALMPVSVILSGRHDIYLVATGAQTCLYAVAALAALSPASRRLPGVSMVFFFVETQVAMAWGLIRVGLGRHSHRWTPVRETPT